MEKDQSATVFSFRSFCCILVVVSSYYYSASSSSSFSSPLYDQNTPINLLTYTQLLKKWPQRNLAGGLERHAITLHLALAKRGHELHIFTTTTNSSLNDTNTNMNFHLSKPTSGGYLDAVHTESIQFGIPESEAALVLGMAGRLVKYKGHPTATEPRLVLSGILAEQDDAFRKRVYVIIAGDGARYKELGSNLLVLGPLKQSELAIFYYAIDVFVNPTLGAQELDHTLLEATLSGKQVMATRFASITGSVIVGPEMGYTFSPTVSSLKDALLSVIGDGRKILEKKGQVGRQRIHVSSSCNIQHSTGFYDRCKTFFTTLLKFLRQLNHLTLSITNVISTSNVQRYNSITV
ncbi:hypothetical protein MKX03_019372 [Papaver bracteatum]|nr:hypothetical protein MKX03_019372 [Papaver bracteatum]